MHHLPMPCKVFAELKSEHTLLDCAKSIVCGYCSGNIHPLAKQAREPRIEAVYQQVYLHLLCFSMAAFSYHRAARHGYESQVKGNAN